MTHRQQQGVAAWVLLTMSLVTLAIIAMGYWAMTGEQEDLGTKPGAGTALTQVEERIQNRDAEDSKGKPNSSAEPLSAASTPVTGVDLTLSGIIIRRDQEQSRALIAEATNPAKSYSPGDEISPGISLETVHSDHIVLGVHGRRETLYLNRTLSSGTEPAGRQLPGSPASSVPSTTKKTDEEEDDWDDEEDDWDDDEDDWDDDEDDWDDEEDDWDDDEENEGLE